MTETYDYGPLQQFEVVWTTGHVETIRAHQVSYKGRDLFGEPRRAWVNFHGEIDGRWTLVLSALEGDLARVRNVTQTEALIAGETA